jgi:hypothetical protein
VSTLESAPVREAEFFVEELAARQLHLGALVFNKVLPEWLLDRGATTAAQALERAPAAVAEALAPVVLADEAQVARVLHEVGSSFMNFQVVARREAEVRAELARTPDVVATVPYLDHDVVDLEGLLQLGDHIWR